MTIFYDSEGNPIEVMSPDDAKALQEKIATFEKEREELKGQLEEKEKALEKANSKEVNFKALRNMSEEEKKKLSTETLGLKTEVEELRTKLETKDKASLEETRTDTMTDLCGEDENLRKQVEIELGLLSMPEGTPKELKAKLQKAYKNATGNSSRPNPLHVGMPSGGFSGYPSERDPKEFGLSQEGMGLARTLGLGYARRMDAEAKKK